ncbi:MAG: chemotaxis protein [Rhodocyclales bacterium]|jgi:methyl-accepting chemotaxis protein|nr:MAG: chemotaxis protein [Rhodocyclales bacterium]
MQSSSISQRLALLAAVPLMALTISAGLLIHDSHGRYRNADQTRILMEVAVAAGNLIHRLQIERGATAGFLQSKGAKFADVLPKYRGDTDARLQTFRAGAGNLPLGDLPDLKQALAAAAVQIDKLGDLRGQADRHALSVAQSAGYYTATIAALVATMDTVARHNADAGIAKRAAAYQAFVRAKESAGLERALTTAGFAADRLEPAQYRAILDRISRQEALFDLFRGAAGEQDTAKLAAILEDAPAREVQRMRDIMAARAASGGFDVDPTVWFARITAKIDGMLALERDLAEGILETANASFAASRLSVLFNLALALAALAAALAVSFWVARGVKGPLTALVEAVEHAVTHDDFTHGVPEKGTLETARAGQALNRLMQKFREIIADAKRSSDGIADAARALATASEQVTKSSSAQAEASSSVAAAVEEASVSVSETASNAQSANEVVVRAGAGVARALAAMGETVSNVNAIAELIRASGASVEQLDRSSQKIGGIVQVIKEIADQTNLLALNAAIEAARAGEQGRGFAVVADEVRKLAERTSKATEEIAGLIRDIQDQIGGTVSGMQQANEQTACSLHLVGGTESALRGVGDDSGKVAQNVQSIADAIREQDAAVHQVAANIERIAQMTEENSAAAEAAAQTAQQLDALAGRLRSVVARYRV